MAALGVLLFLANNPSTIFLKADSHQAPSILYNADYSYYSSQSVEMLHADYWSRLRVQNFYPREWQRYHFFHGSTQALAQSLLRSPNGLSHLMAQTSIMILIFLGLAECLLGAESVAPNFAIGVCTLWLVISFLWFSESTVWNVRGTGALSFFSIVASIISLSQKRFWSCFLFLMFLGVTAFRCLPFSFAMMAIIFFVYRRELGVSRVIKKLKAQGPPFWLFVTLWIAYNGVTYFSRGTEKNLFERHFFNDGWENWLVGYKILGYIIHPLMARLHNSRFGLYDETPFLRNTTLLPYYFLFVGFLLFFFRRLLFQKRQIPALVTVGAVLLVSILISKDLFTLNLMFAPYLLCTWGLLNSHPDKPYLRVIFISQVVALLYQYIGADEIATPVATLAFDALAWTAVGLLVLEHQRPKNAFVWLAGFALAGMFFLHFRGIGALTFPGEYLNRLIAVSTLSEGHLIGHGLEGEYRASILGKRLPYDPKKDWAPNWRFVQQ